MIVFFNGPSVRHYLSLYLDNHVKIGCNWMFERTPLNHCVCLDWRMQDNIDEAYPDLVQSTRFWCQNGFQRPGWQPISYPMTEQPQNSGMLALTLAVQLQPREIWVVGCDWGLNNLSLFDYGDRNSEHKYTNDSRHLMRTLSERVPIRVVHSKAVDVPVPIVSPEQFRDQLEIKV